MSTENVVAVVAIVVVVWTPLELLNSYMEYFVFVPDDFRRSLRFSRLLNHSIGLIATAALISIGAASTRDDMLTWSQSIAAGIKAWPRTFWTLWLARLATGMCLILLIVPGIYVGIRLCLAGCVAVVERTSGRNALRRSWELTSDGFWFLFKFWVFAYFLLAFVAVVSVAPVVLVPHFDNWIINALASLPSDFALAFIIICLYCVYDDLDRSEV